MAKNSRVKTAIIGVGLGLLFGLGITPAIAQENNKKESLVSNLPFTYSIGFNTEILENGIYTIKLVIKYGYVAGHLDKLKLTNSGVIFLTGDKRYPTVETKGIYRYGTDNPTKIYEYNDDINPRVKEIADTLLAEEAYKYIRFKKPRKNKPNINSLIDDLIETLMAKKVEA